MSAVNDVVRSVPLDEAGNPVDKSRPLLPPARARSEEDAPARDSIAEMLAASKPVPTAEERRAASAPPSKPSPAKAERKPIDAEFIGERAKGRKHPLAHPLRAGGVEYHSTILRSPEGSKFVDFALYQAEYTLDVICMWLISDLPIEVVEVLSFEDKLEIAEAAPDFLPRRILAATQEAEVGRTE